MYLTDKLAFYLFNDIGSVWMIEDDNSERWHDGYGIGVSANPF